MVENEEELDTITEDDWWPDWIEELFDQTEGELPKVSKSFKWKFLEEEEDA
jgi:hypothetical protein